MRGDGALARMRGDAFCVGTGSGGGVVNHRRPDGRFAQLACQVKCRFTCEGRSIVAWIYGWTSCHRILVVEMHLYNA